MAREEIIAAPLELYLAPVGESFPDLGEDPSGDWELVGASGDENYTDDGVTLGLPQSVEEFTPAGTAMPVKAFRTEEGIEITVTVADVRAETLQYALNGNDVDETTGQREISLLRGIQVTEYALLARGQSPYEDDGDNQGQFQVPRVYMSSEPEPVFNKGEPAGVELAFRSLLPNAESRDDLRVIYPDASIV